MVLLKEISEGIWGIPLGPNKSVDIVTEHPVRLTMAALEVDDGETQSSGNGLTRVTLKSSTADKGPATDLILCNLHYPSCLQQPLDIELYDGQTLSFAVKGPHRVHLTGYRLQPELEEMHEEGHESCAHAAHSHPIFQTAPDDDDSSDEDDEDDDEDDDDSDDDDDLELVQGRVLRDDEDQDLEGDYEDGYVEGEDQLDSDASSDSDDDEEEEQHLKKGKKRTHPEANGHAKKQEPQTKKNKKSKEEPSSSNGQASKPAATKPEKKGKKDTPAAKEAVQDTKASSTTGEQKKKSNELEIKDVRVGNGPEAKIGKMAGVYYTGRLMGKGTPFDSCTKGKPFKFRLGAGEVIKGWDQGVKGMRVGGKRQLVIPPALAYGNKRIPDIPPNSTLVFDVELKNVY